jgi:hypothetical protein
MSESKKSNNHRTGKSNPDSKTSLDDLRSNITLAYYLEYAVLLFFMTLAATFFVLSNGYPFKASFFPRIISSVAFISALAIMIRKYYNREDELVTETKTQNKNDINTNSANSRGKINSDEIFILALSTGYAISGILVGLTWVTPIFVFIYCKWSDWLWLRSLIFAAMSLSIPIFFTKFLSVDFSQGLLL